MTITPLTPVSDSSTMSNGLNGVHEDLEKLQVNGVQPNGNGRVSPDGPLERRKLARKQSSPMMPAFMVSAPGKVIVFGEHAVVHGKAAIAAAISLRSYLLVTSLSKSRRTVTMRFPDIDMAHTWNIDELPWEIFSRPDKKKYYYDLVTSLDTELMELSSRI